jgi:hypothetical protein
MTPEQRELLRSRLGTAVLAVQLEYRENGTSPEVFMPELIAGLLSLAGSICRDAAGLDDIAFLRACVEAMKETYGDGC